MTDKELKEYIEEKICDYCFVTCCTISRVIATVYDAPNTNSPINIDVSELWNKSVRLVELNKNK